MNDPPFPFVAFFALVPELHFPKWCRKMDKVLAGIKINKNSRTTGQS